MSLFTIDFYFYFSDQLIILLANFDDLIAISSSMHYLQTDFQRIKYPIIWISQTFIGLILIHKSSIKAYYSK